MNNLGKFKIKKNQFGNVLANLLVLFFWIITITFYTNAPFNLDIYTNATYVIGFLGWCVLICRKYDSNESKIFIRLVMLFLIITLLGLLSGLYTQIWSLASYLSWMLLFCSMGMLYIFFEINKFLSYCLMFIYSAILLIYYINHGNLDLVLDPGGNSYNYVTVLMIALICNVVISGISQKEMLVLCIVYFISAILAGGRGGILSSMVLLVLFGIYR